MVTFYARVVQGLSQNTESSFVTCTQQETNE